MKKPRQEGWGSGGWAGLSFVGGSGHEQEGKSIIWTLPRARGRALAWQPCPGRWSMGLSAHLFPIFSSFRDHPAALGIHSKCLCWSSLP